MWSSTAASTDAIRAGGPQSARREAARLSEMPGGSELHASSGCWAGDELTLGDTGDGKVFVAVGLSQSEQDVDLGPVGDDFLDEADLGAVQLLELADLALVL
jgi:hypothetical protein